MSVLKQINAEEFTSIIGSDQFNKFLDIQGLICVIFISDWSVPSALTIKRIKKFNFDKGKLGIIDVDLVDSIDLCQRFQVKSVPCCFLFKNKEKMQSFTGYRIEALNQIFNLMVKQYLQTQKKAKKSMSISCPQSHPLSLMTSLPQDIYVDGFFFCDHCFRIQKCQKDREMGHCAQCDHDMCNDCLNGMNK